MGSVKREGFQTIPSAAGGIARLVCARLREAGRDVAAVLSRAGLTVQQVDNPAERLEVPAEIKVLELAAEELQDDLLGFHLARSFDLREIGLVYYVMACSEQLADALRNAERYSAIVNEGVRLHLSFDRSAALAIEYLDVDRCSDRHHMEFWLVTLVRLCRQLTHSRLAPRQLKIRHLRTRPLMELTSFFGTDAKFGAGVDEIVFSAPVVSLPIVGRDMYLNKLLRRYADEALASRPRGRASLRSKVERIVPRLLPHGKARASEVAQQLGMSSRTFSRKLREEGAGYAEILGQLRASLAKRYLRQRELPVSEVAWLLGYREVNSLAHAFSRWTGMTPIQYQLSSEAGQTDTSRIGS